MARRKQLSDINRRYFLKGIGALAVPLPIFDFMLNSNGTAYAQSNLDFPKRFIIVKAGNSPCADYDDALDITGNPRNLLVPLNLGANYKVGPALASLDTYAGLKDYVGVFSNCALNHTKLTSASGSLNNTPPGGVYGNFHEVMNYAMMTGRRTWRLASGDYDFDFGPSADQLLKAALNPTGSTIHANYRAQFTAQNGRGDMQFSTKGAEIPANASPRSIFNELFSNFAEPSGAASPAQLLAFDNRKSILDYLDKGRVSFLKRNLGARDLTILTDHLDYIRELELRVATSPATSSNASCQRKADPGADPGLVSDAYYDEDKRADVIIDLLAMAMACDIVRHGTFRVTTDQSFLSAVPFGVNGVNFHDLTHYNSLNTTVEDSIKVVAWTVSKFFKLANALKSLPEGTGNILDNSALVYHAEGGHGPSIDEAVNFNVSHSSENICVLVAGKAGNLKVGSHVKTNRAHPVAVTLAAMKAVGYKGTAVGDITSHEPLVWNG